MKPPVNDCVVLSDSDDDCIISDSAPYIPDNLVVPDDLVVGPAIGLDTDIVVCKLLDGLLQTNFIGDQTLLFKYKTIDLLHYSFLNTSCR